MKTTFILFIFILSIVQINAQVTEISEESYTDSSTIELSIASKKINSLPEFPGGNVELAKYLTNNIRYPRNSNNSSSRGKVLLCFKVDEDGKISNVNIIEGINKILNKEAKRVVENMPNWKPAFENGIAVSNSITIPIMFYRI